MLSERATPMLEWLAETAHPQLERAFAIRTHLTRGERVKLYKLTREAAPAPVVLEVGSYIGASTCCFGAAVSELGGGRVYCVDTWNNDAMTEGSRDTYAEFLRNTEAFAPWIVPVRGFSTAVAAEVAKRAGRVDLLFVDGDHAYDGVKGDWRAYAPLLKPGSTIVFHDWGWAEGVKRVVEEDVLPAVSRFGHLPNMWWGRIRP